ncbi:FYN-binding protein 1 isoform X2 [Coregonus clupeaformis]|uniref:FYN-binding protein 1 isoform X2 n=1 Tax=Coregonus clupeaformis TaxID=59861 RepID=UPI001E1C8B10|nr:FYN-binding protein 1 isoform X2 [Coregonus clupeaformis]
MNNKSDIKAITARFSTGGNSTEGMSTGRPKAAVHPTLSSGPPIQPKKPVLETSLSGSAASTAPKPSFIKNTVSTKSAPEVRELPKNKTIASMFESAQEDNKPSFVKQYPFKSKPPGPELSHDAEIKSPLPKTPLQKPSLSSTLFDTKPAFPKPPLVVAKPSWVKDSSPKPDDSGGTPNKLPPSKKPISSIAKMRLQTEDSVAGAVDSTIKPFTPGNTLKPSNVRTAQNAFNRGDTLSEEGVKEVAKLPLTSSDSCPPKPIASKKPSITKKPLGYASPVVGVNPSVLTNSSSVPKRNPLPNILALGTAPAKPNRPPRVNLEKLKKGTAASTDGPAGFRKGSVPPPPASHPSNSMAPPLPSNPMAPSLPSNPMAPSLPPRPPGAIIQPDPDENYDDVGLMNNPPSQRTEDSESDEEMYEDLDKRWGPVESKEQEKKREREGKKQQEVEKKEQKERERKEQEARKKFKLTGPLEVIHRVKAKLDSKGSKTDLGLKQGESIDIMRVLDNPEGRWLGRSQDGSYGYVKTESVAIDFDTLKRQGVSIPSQMEHEPEVYDDVDFHNDLSSGIKGPGMVLPPPPEEVGDIYDDLDDSSFNVSPSPSDPRLPPKPRGLSWVFKGFEEWRKGPGSKIEVRPPSQFDQEGNTEQSAEVIDEEIYDDVDVTNFPPTPPISSLPRSKTKDKAEDKDPKKLKKFEKEEKDFRKKFKHDREIQVLYQVTIVSTLANKKWSSKDLPLRPGETVDVIVKPVDNKLICRNEEGKFGYVLTSHIVVEDSDIYDDIGDDCIYDND